MAIISARHKCPGCGREWTMPVNTGWLDWEEFETAMRERRARLETVCGSCRSRKTGPRRESG